MRRAWRCLCRTVYTASYVWTVVREETPLAWRWAVKEYPDR